MTRVRDRHPRVSLPIFRSLILSPWEALGRASCQTRTSNMFPGVRHASWKALGMLPGKHPRNVPISPPPMQAHEPSGQKGGTTCSAPKPRLNQSGAPMRNPNQTWVMNPNQFGPRWVTRASRVMNPNQPSLGNVPKQTTNHPCAKNNQRIRRSDRGRPRRPRCP